MLGANKHKDKEIIELCVAIFPKQMTDLNINYFYKGLLLSSLCSIDNLFEEYKQVIKELYNQIISNQLPDGSWEGDYSLLMPHPSVLNVNENIKWIKDNKGTNIITKDFNRVFTTVSCLMGVSAYEKRV